MAATSPAGAGDPPGVEREQRRCRIRVVVVMRCPQLKCRRMPPGVMPYQLPTRGEWHPLTVLASYPVGELTSRMVYGPRGSLMRFQWTCGDRSETRESGMEPHLAWLRADISSG